MNTVFPTRNLGPGDPWARRAEELICQLQRQVQQIEQRLSNDGRALSGMSESIAEQIGEIQNQQKIIGQVLESIVDTQSDLNLIRQIMGPEEPTEDDPSYIPPEDP